MSTPGPNPDDTAKMTPEAAAIIARARKSFIFTIGLLIVGFIVIGGALVYRATKDSGGAPADAAAYTAAAVRIPVGATIVSMVAVGGDISVTYKNGSATSLRIFDGKTGAILREIPVVSE
ncbi:MAG: hypothetical protein ABI377_12635 [Devosia sp.]